MLKFCTEEHYFGVWELWFEAFCHAEISTKDPLMEVDVALVPFDTFLFVREKCQGGLSINTSPVSNHQRLTTLSSTEEGT